MISLAFKMSKSRICTDQILLALNFCSNLGVPAMLSESVNTSDAKNEDGKGYV